MSCTVGLPTKVHAPDCSVSAWTYDVARDGSLFPTRPAGPRNHKVSLAEGSTLRLSGGVAFTTASGVPLDHPGADAPSRRAINSNL